MQSHLSICLSVCFHSFELTDIWPWPFACVLVVTGSPGIVGQRSRSTQPQTLTWSVWPQSSIEDSFLACIFVWHKYNLFNVKLHCCLSCSHRLFCVAFSTCAHKHWFNSCFYSWIWVIAFLSLTSKECCKIYVWSDGLPDASQVITHWHS